MTKKKIEVSSGKAKGRRLQQLVAEKISDLTGIPCGKDQPIESRPMGQSGPDIRLDPLAREHFPFSVECKNQQNWAVPKAIKQAKDNLYPHTDWLLVLKKNHISPVVVLDLDVFFRILADLEPADIDKTMTAIGKETRLINYD